MRVSIPTSSFVPLINCLVVFETEHATPTLAATTPTQSNKHIGKRKTTPIDLEEEIALQEQMLSGTPTPAAKLIAALPIKITLKSTLSLPPPTPRAITTPQPRSTLSSPTP